MRLPACINHANTHHGDITFMLKRTILKSGLIGFFLIVSSQASQAVTFTSGDFFASSLFSNQIGHYNSTGTYLDSLTLPSTYGSDVKGLSFGPDGLLYAVSSNGSGFGVSAIDSTGAVAASYSGPGYIAGNVGFGKISFGQNGQFFVAGANNLVAFTPGSASGSVIYTNNQVFDVKALPTGNLLVLSAYSLQEITTGGSVVRTINPDISLVDARGIEYDPVNNDIFLTELGSSNQSFHLLRLDGTTGQVEVNKYFWYGADLYFTADNKLVVGSTTQAAGIFDTDLNQIGTFSTAASRGQVFITQVTAVPEPSSVLTLLSGIALLGGVLRRRKKASLQAAN
jgi:hypothetical protein